MQPPSLYSHFASKNAIYDAMYAEAWLTYEESAAALEPLPEHPRVAIAKIARGFFDFAVADLARHQLMNQRTIPGFEPSADAYAPAVRVLEQCRAMLAGCGVTDSADVDIWLALIGGLIDQQLANDPRGDRYSRLLERAIDMWADAIGVPKHSPAATKAARKR